MRINKFKELIYRCDFFKTTEYFRYNQEPQYRTLTGAICSIIIVVVFASIFSASIINTFDKKVITWQYGLSQTITEELNITANSFIHPHFMFAVGVDDINLVSGSRYFNFRLEQIRKDTNGVKTTSMELLPCNRSDWEGLDKSILQIFDRQKFENRLCPPINSKFSIAGTKSSLNFKYMKISIDTCSNDSLDTRPCVNNAVLTDFLTNNTNFHFNLYFINGLINPSDPKEINFYLEDRNYVPFNLGYGGQVNLFMSKYQITTDESILPNQNTRVSTGGIVNFVGQYIASRVLGRNLATINIKKSNLSMYIYREYTKIDQNLSYIGGLFNFILIAFVFMQVYTQCAFEIDIGDKLYHYDKKSPLESSKFNFFTFILYIFYSILEFFGCEIKWELMKKYDQCRDEVQKQFDICFLMQRIIFLERSLRILFEDHQFKGLHMHEKLTLKQAQELRSCYDLKDKMNVFSNTEHQMAEDSNQSQSSKVNNKDQPNVSQFNNQFNNTESPIHNSHQIDPVNNLSKEFKREMPRPSKRSKVNKRINKANFFQSGREEDQLQKKQTHFFEEVTKMAINDESNTNKIFNSHPIESSFHTRLKLLRKESQEGNVISQKIYKGFNNNEILLGILSKMQSQNVKSQGQHRKGSRDDIPIANCYQKHQSLENNIDSEQKSMDKFQQRRNVSKTTRVHVERQKKQIVIKDFQSEYMQQQERVQQEQEQTDHNKRQNKDSKQSNVFQYIG